MNFIKKNLLTFLILFLLSIVPMVSLAQPISGTPSDICPPGKICNPLKTDTINDFLKNLLRNVIRIGIPIIALAIIYSGFLFVSARGNPSEIENAKNALLYTLIGSALLLGSWALAQLISNTVLSL